MLDASSSHPDRQRMPEYIQRIPPRLDPLQARVVLFVIQRMPWHAGCIQPQVREIGVGMIDEGPIVRLARDRDAAALREQIPIERPYPRQILRLFQRIQPARADSGRIRPVRRRSSVVSTSSPPANPISRASDRSWTSRSGCSEARRSSPARARRRARSSVPRPARSKRRRRSPPGT
jgi:hypothetical protein